MAKKYYAVRVGRKNGIYMTWDECKANVSGYSGAEYKSFLTMQEAEDYINAKAEIVSSNKTLDKNPDRIYNGNSDNSSRVLGSAHAIGDNVDGIIDYDINNITDDYAFVDGSFNQSTGVYGYGGFLVHNGERIVLQGSGSDAEMASMRNVAGEVLGSMAAIKKAVELGISSIAIYYDYSGIQMWATGEWKRNKTGTKAYYEYINSVKDSIEIRFVKVKGHSGVEGNEEADRLAKQAVGIL